MASLYSLNITVSCDLGYMPAQLECIRGFMAADNDLDRRIELSAFNALCDLQKLGDKFKRELGLINHETAAEIAVRMTA